MVKLKEIKDFLNSIVPFELQDSWDNSGVQFGEEEAEIKKVGLALSVSRNVIKGARERGIDLLITHHPLTISGLKRFEPELYPQNLLIELVRSSIYLISLHTNLDVSPLGPTAVICDYLGLVERRPIQQNPPYGVVGELPREMRQLELLEELTKFLPDDVYRTVLFKPDEKVRRIAVCSGSGASFIDAVSRFADVYITGDVKYHDAVKALDLGLTLFDLGHFGTERLFFKELLPLLVENFPEVEFFVLDEKSPFEVVKC
ncbi:MAG: Nif3-like dinuclear metal center hexameric protein [Thermovibrio sp.]|nr:MAG: Nif3-like dinuclear metal center hexameric protein [Thermovibrio sp.]